MGSPLSGNGVHCVHDPYRTSLAVGPSSLRARADSNRPALPAPAHAGVMHQDLVRGRPSRAFVPGGRLPRAKPELAFVILRHGSPNPASPPASLRPSLGPHSLVTGR